MSELRITDTNSANDSKGRAFGLEGNNFMYVVVSFVAALGFYLLLNGALHMSGPTALLFVLPIFLVPSAWVLLFRHNKAPGYAEDLYDSLLNKEGWAFKPHFQP